MLKLPLALLFCLGTCAAQDAHPITELQGTSRVLIVFAPSQSSADFKKQLMMIERHAYELAEHNTVVVPVSAPATGTDAQLTGENMPLPSTVEQANARSRFHVQPGDFLVILLNQDGTVQIRSAAPVDIHQLTASLDSHIKH